MWFFYFPTQKIPGLSQGLNAQGEWERIAAQKVGGLGGVSLK